MVSLDIIPFPEIIDVGECVRGVELKALHISSVRALCPDVSRIQFPHFPIRALDYELMFPQVSFDVLGLLDSVFVVIQVDEFALLLEIDI